MCIRDRLYTAKESFTFNVDVYIAYCVRAEERVAIPSGPKPRPYRVAVWPNVLKPKPSDGVQLRLDDDCDDADVVSHCAGDDWCVPQQAEPRSGLLILFLTFLTPCYF